MKFQLPDALKASVPHNIWGRILAATPVVMTVVATMLAGLSSSEMTRAQYSRSLAAQQQSKAGDQWSYFQAKRLRGAMQRSALDLLQSTTDLRPLDFAAVEQAVAQSHAREAAPDRNVLLMMQEGRLPDTPAAPALDSTVKAALDAVENGRPEHEIAELLAHVNPQALDAALRGAVERAHALDAATKPVSQEVERIEGLLSRQQASRQLSRDFIAARLRYTAMRYDAEARLNQAIANLYELQVRKSNIDAERHHARSQRFFYGMLAAQAAVIIATFSIAAQKRNLLWALAAAAGAAAVFFAIYVYLFV